MTIMPALIRSTVACTVASAVASAVACAVVMIASHAIAGPFTFDDVDYWVGTGTSRAALVIDWVENSTEPAALVWGYRWDGTAYGRDMLTAIVAADDRLFAKLGGSPTNPVAVYGLGYDANNDGTFALDGGSGFDAGGFAYTGPADGSTSLDAADYYAEGWFTGFWHFGIASLNPYDGGSWSDIPAGMAGRLLADGAWDSWTFSPTFNFAAFAENPSAAATPFPPGDFNRDQQVDDLDYQLWKSEFGSTNSPAVDGNGNGVVDAADYTIWRNHVGLGAGSWAAGDGVPEPTSLWFTLCSVWVLWLASHIRRKVNVS
jgi:hypothetical protein